MNEVDRPWCPVSPCELPHLFAQLPAPWWVAGGSALDLWDGEISRAHADTDVLVLRDDLPRLHAALPHWQLWMADPPGHLQRWPAETVLPDHVHDIWCRHRASGCWQFQFMVSDTRDGEWLYRRDPRIRRPVSSIGVSVGNLTVLAPEIQLLFKSRPSRRPKDDADLRRFVPNLSPERRAWLLQSVSLAHPDALPLPAAEDDAVAPHRPDSIH